MWWLGLFLVALLVCVVEAAARPRPREHDLTGRSAEFMRYWRNR